MATLGKISRNGDTLTYIDKSGASASVDLKTGNTPLSNAAVQPPNTDQTAHQLLCPAHLEPLSQKTVR